MIIGIGIDMIEIERVTKACKREHFVKRIFTEAEQRLIETSIRKAASNFAVKEAVVKALHTGFNGIWPDEIEVLRNGEGCPYVTLYRGASRCAEKLGVTKIHVSITNTLTQVSAFVVMEG